LSQATNKSWSRNWTTMMNCGSFHARINSKVLLSKLSRHSWKVAKVSGYLVETQTNLLTRFWLHYQQKVSVSHLQLEPMARSWWQALLLPKDSLDLTQLPQAWTSLTCSRLHVRSMETLQAQKSSQSLQQEIMGFPWWLLFKKLLEEEWSLIASESASLTRTVFFRVLDTWRMVLLGYLSAKKINRLCHWWA